MVTAPVVENKPSVWQALANRRMLVCIMGGFSSGLPLFVYYNLLQAFLKTEGVDLKAIAAFSLFAARLFPNARAALLLLIPTSLPIFFLSGATWPREAMPGWVSALGALTPD